jgi:hypothetical protein
MYSSARSYIVVFKRLNIKKLENETYGNMVIQDEAVVMIVSPFPLLPCSDLQQSAPSRVRG